MSRTRWLGLGAALLVLALPTSVWAEESGLAQVPANAPVVIQIHGLERTRDRLVTMVKNAVPEAGNNLQNQFEQWQRTQLSGRELKGLVPDGPVFIVFTALPEANQSTPPSVAILLHVTDFNAFRDGILKADERKNLESKAMGIETTTLDNGHTVYLLQRPGYAVVTERKDVAEQFTRQQSGLTLNQEQTRKFLNPDVGVYVNMTAVNQKYGEQLKKFRLSQARGEQQSECDCSDTEPACNAVCAAFVQGMLDSRTVLEGIEFRPHGLAFHSEADVAADSKTNQFLKHFERSALREVGELPAGQLGYVGLQVTPEAFQTLVRIKERLTGVGEANAVTDQLLKEFAAANPRWVAGAVNFPPRGLRVWDFEDPQRAVAAELKAFEAFAAGKQLPNLPLKGKPEISKTTYDYRGFELHHIRLTWDLNKMLGRAGVPDEACGATTTAALRKVLGEGVNCWFGTDGETYVEVWGQHWRSARRLLDHYLDGKKTVREVSAFESARKHLPEQATFFALIDVPRYMREVAEPFIMQHLKANGSTVALPSCGATEQPSFMGVAVGLQAERANFDLWFPGMAVREIYQRWQPMFSRANQEE